MCISVYLEGSGKRPTGSTVAVSSVGPNQPSQLLLCDDITGRTFLIDTGAQVSLLPSSRTTTYPNIRNNSPKLQAANGTSIPSYGTLSSKVSFGGRRFSVTFVLADIRRPIIGADFLRRHNLLVDLCGQCLIDAHTFQTYECQTGDILPTIAPIVFNNNPYSQLLHKDFPELLQPTFSISTPSHGVCHHIPTLGRPVHSKARRLSPEKLAIAKQEFFEMERMGIVRKSNSPWSPPLHMVKKTNGWRPCGDYRRLNSATTPDRYPVPHLTDLSARLSGCSIFSKIDLVRGYHQVGKYQSPPRTYQKPQ